MPITRDYPRDLVGYGRQPPQADWPGGARVAVQFVLNLEEGGENCVLHGDAGSEQFLSEIIGAASYPDRRLSNDMRFASPQGLNAAGHFYDYMRDSFDTLYAEGATPPRMMSIGMHCRLLGRPAGAHRRAAAFSRISVGA